MRCKHVPQLAALTLMLAFIAVFSFALSAAAKGASPKKGSIPDDGVNDTWHQDGHSKMSGKNDAICERAADGRLHLKAGSGNMNNGDGSKPPAVFLDDTMTAALAAATGEKTVSMKVTPSSVNGKLCFGLYLNYREPGKGFFIGFNTAGGWFWQQYGVAGNPYGAFTGDALKKDQTYKLELKWNGTAVTSFTVNGTATSLNQDFSSVVAAIGASDAVGIKCGNNSEVGGITEVLASEIHYSGQSLVVAYDVTGRVSDGDSGAGVEGATVKIGDEPRAHSDRKGAYTINGLRKGSYTLTFEKEGYVAAKRKITVADRDVTGADASLKPKAVDEAVLSTARMDVRIDRNFPRVIQYTMKGDLAGKIMYGQTDVLDKVRINGIDVLATVEPVTITKKGTCATYEMDVRDDANHINLSMRVVIKVKGNKLELDIPKVANHLDRDAFPIETIYFPNHSLVSVRSSEAGANLKGAAMSMNTQVSGDESVALNGGAPEWGERDYMYAYVSYDNGLSAGVESNTAYDGRAVAAGVSVGSHNTRVMACFSDMGSYQSIGLASTPFVYNYRLKDPGTGMTYTMQPLDMPVEKIAIAGDENEDGSITWQDGAIAQRDVIHPLRGSAEVPDLVSTRISMNFGSQAQNPFLTTLDNVKRVSLITDGLGQSVLLKGYANEGHDSGHPDYGDIGKRVGGAKDLNYLLEHGKEYGARFGVHINASEMYPEAKAFSDKLTRYTDGKNTIAWGWNWLDQAAGIDGAYDIASGSRERRLSDLHDKVGGKLDYIYLDVYGNNTSGDESSWPTRAISKMVTSKGWRMTNEWGGANEYDSTFQHWAGDLTYGGYSMKGYNSEVMRFLRNHERDSWIADYPGYGGAANAPLLGGNTMKDFEGWQGRNDYDAYIDNLYSFNLSTKFLQHYQVTKWVDGDPVTMTTGKNTYTWSPEKEITLKDKSGNTVVVTRGSTDPASPKYRFRTITLNGKTVLSGTMDNGDWTGKGTEAYLIPWYWKSDGKKLGDGDQKLYHWNNQGGSTEWTLPSGWEHQSSVVVYRLTDQGKTDPMIVPVRGGKISLRAEAATPYVVCKGRKANRKVKWSESMHLTDVSFNSASLDSWDAKGDGTAAIAKSQYNNPMLKLTGEKALTQQITDITSGKSYAVYVGVDNRSDASAHMTITDAAGKKLADTYTGRSIAKNYVKAYTHNTNSATVDGASYFQNMYVFFTAPKTGEIYLTLSRERGDGDTYFDDVRVVESKADNIGQRDKDGNVTKFEQDFENSAQGIYPFVIGKIEGVEDNRTHLSEKHAPYTQAGWNVKKLDDVLDGAWSLKTNGLSEADDLVYQTIPQNFRFLPGVTYRVSFDYQCGSPNAYAVTYGDGEYAGGTPKLPLDGCIDTKSNTVPGTNTGTRRFTFNITGAEDAQTWFGIYSTSEKTQTGSTSGSAASFGGYGDLILDNLVIEQSDVQKGDLEKAITEAGTKFEADYTHDSWMPFARALEQARAVMADVNASADAVEAATRALRAAGKKLVALSCSLGGTLTGVGDKPVAGARISLTASNLAAPLTTKTDKDGAYEFKGIFVRDYHMVVTAQGYETAYDDVKLAAGQRARKDLGLVMKEAADYTNAFADGDVSMMRNLTGNTKEIAFKTGESGTSAQMDFPGVHASGYDGNSPKAYNGVFEADVTSLDGGSRFGMMARGTDMTHRVYIGLEDDNATYFAEYWNGAANSWTAAASGPTMGAGVTRHWKLVTRDGSAVLFVDGRQILSVDISAAGGTSGADLPSGYFGFESRASGRFVVTNLEVTSTDAAAADTRTITGTVLDAKGAPFFDAQVRVFDSRHNVIARTHTNLLGRYTLKGIPYGTYRVKFSAKGASSTERKVEVGASGPVVVDDVTLQAAKKKRLDGQKRVLDS